MKKRGTCRCRLVADSLDIKFAAGRFENESIAIDRDFAFFFITRESGIYAFFDFGVCVEWGEKIDDLFLQSITDVNVSTLPVIDYEYLDYDFSGEDRKIDDDVVYIPCDENFQKVIGAYSFAIAQAHKLSVYESLITKTIDKSIHIPSELANKGLINLSSRKTAKLRGELFLIKSDINLGFELLDTPKYFWEHPNEEIYYNEMINYLEISQRINVLNKKINVVSEILEMLSDEQKHQDSSFLERVIIFLILVEVVIFLLHDVMKLF